MNYCDMCTVTNVVCSSSSLAESFGALWNATVTECLGRLSCLLLPAPQVYDFMIFMRKLGRREIDGVKEKLLMEKFLGI